MLYFQDAANLQTAPAALESRQMAARCQLELGERGREGRGEEGEREGGREGGRKGGREGGRELANVCVFAFLTAP